MPYNIFRSKGKNIYIYSVRQPHYKYDSTGGYIIADNVKSAKRKAQIAIHESNMKGEPVKIRRVKSSIKIGTKSFNI